MKKLKKTLLCALAFVMLFGAPPFRLNAAAGDEGSADLVPDTIYSTRTNTAFAAANGRLWSWGYGNYGQLGNGALSNTLVPAPISAFEDVAIQSLAAGTYAAYALDEEGRVWSWGSTGYVGALGIGETDLELKITSPVQITFSEEVTIEAIAAGDSTGYALDDTGNLWAWGSNSSGELGNGTTTNSNVPRNVTTGGV
jgi:hypothetical protein